MARKPISRGIQSSEQGYAEALRLIDEARQLNWTELNLSGLQLTAVPKELGELKALTTLDLSDNQLTAVPKELWELKSVTRLYLVNNQITTVPKELGELKALTYLSLGGNRLVTVPEELGELKALTTLHIFNNKLTAVPKELGELKALTSLGLSNNQLTSVPKELGELEALTTLYLDDNRLTAVPKELGKLGSLTELELGGNQLTALPRELGDLKALTELFLHGNASLLIPPEVLGVPWKECHKYGGTKDPAKPSQILAYYFALNDGTDRPLNEAKILVVGEPGVGKTMLVEWLTKGKPKKNPEWTKGIKILPWKVKGSAHAQTDIRVNVWDFGGQEIMQATHQFFLTERSLYLLVLDSRENEEQSKVRYWLDKIRAFGGDSPVIVALNKRDEGQQDPDENRLRLDYPDNLREATFFRTACKAAKGIPAGQGINELREAIACRVRQLDNVTQKVPANYFKAKTAFESASRAKKRMDRDAFDAICKKCGIKDEIGRDTLLSYLKSLGSLFHYKRGEHSHKTLVLDPQWLTGGVYKLLTDHHVKENAGVLTSQDVNRAFGRSKSYDKDARSFIQDMMEGDPFELSFKIPETDGHRLIPELLPPSEPPHGISPAQSLSVQFHYKFLPAGLIPRFIVRMHNALNPGDAWKNGVVVKVDGRRVLVRGVREEKRVYVSAEGRGPGARRALAIVRQNLDMVHRAMKHLEVTEHVALPDDPGTTISYNDLLQYEADETPAYTFRPPGSKQKYSIRELLDGIEAADWRVGPQGFSFFEDHKGEMKPVFQRVSDVLEVQEPDELVFISYANEPDPLHAQRVRDLADKLREQGVNAIIDQYLPEMGPNEGWQLWMKQQVQRAKTILMVCSPAYIRRIEGKEKPGKGLGATYEGKLIQQDLYNEGIMNSKCRAVVLDKDHSGCIPFDVQSVTHFNLYEDHGYDRLYRALTGQPRIIAPPLGKPILLPPDKK